MIKKEACREQEAKRRQELSLDDWKQLNQGLLMQFKQLSLEHITYLHSFLPIQAKKEPDTFLLIQYLAEAWPAIQVAVPRSDLSVNTMTHHLYPGQANLLRNPWGIWEPQVGAAEILPEQLDLVLIPLLAVDRKGNRVGYGKGYYDRFLGQCKAGVQKVGLSLFEPLDELIEADPFDIPLDLCVTPHRIWNFTSNQLTK